MKQEPKNELKTVDPNAVGFVGAEQVADWQKKHGNVHPVHFTGKDGKEAVAYFREVTREEFAYMLSITQNFDQCSELAQATFLGGSEEVLIDWKLKFSAGQELLQVNVTPAVKLGKL